MIETNAILIGGPRDGKKLSVRDSTPCLQVPVSERRPVLADLAGSLEFQRFQIVTYRREKYFVRGVPVCAYIADGVDAKDAFWDLLGLTVAQQDEKNLPTWLTNNRRRIAGKLWNLAENMTAAIFDSAIRLRMRIQ